MIDFFLQTFILIALLGGVYVPCIIAMLPDKKRESYDVLFSLIWDYLNLHNLPNTFSSDYFMTDFEVSSSFGKMTTKSSTVSKYLVNIFNSFKISCETSHFLQVSIRSSFRMFWPGITLLGCYFHFSQLIWRRVKGN